MSLSKSDLIFQQWKASLPSRDRSRGATQLNFEELFSDLKAEGNTFEEVHSNFLPKAIKAHYPSTIHVRNAWKRNKQYGKWSSEKELEDTWKQETDSSAEQAFFNVFPVETKGEKPTVEEPVKKDQTPHGNMSAEEYRMMREHADSFPNFDFDALEKQKQEVSEVMDNFDDFLRTVTSESK